MFKNVMFDNVDHSTTSMYADESQVYRAIGHVEYRLLLQRDPDRISDGQRLATTTVTLKTYMLTIGIDRSFLQ